MTYITNNKNKIGAGKKSIRGRITLTFILVIMIMTVVFFFSITRRNIINNVYQDNVDINLSLNQLSLELNNNAKSFDLYFQTRDEEQYKSYLSSRDTISHLITDLKESIMKDEESYIFFRNLSNMLNYHDDLFKQLFSAADTSNSESYRILTDIRTLYLYMNSHAQTLIIEYQDYSSTRYMDLLEDYQDMERKIYVIIILTSILCLLFALALSNDLLKTIDRLSLSAISLSNGHWEIPDIEENKYSELNILGQTFNLMKNNINKFIKELKQKSELEIKFNKQKIENIEKDRLIKESKLMSLQMQMDPHFLFNTLNTVARTALFEGAKKTEELVVAVAKMMRYNLDNKGKMVGLNKEVEVLKAYLIIQQTRFQSQMKFNISVEGDVSDIMVPPMILQPIVENAVIHGLADKDENGRIDIEIIKKTECLEIKIIDNGKGIKTDNIANVFQQKYKKEAVGSSTGLGLANVKKRLELHYGRDLVEINSALGKGTEVIIQIPLNEGGYE